MDSVVSGRVPFEQLLPPGFPSKIISFSYNFFDAKFRYTCPGIRSLHGQISRTSELISDAILALSDESQTNTFLCSACNVCLFIFPRQIAFPLMSFLISFQDIMTPTRSVGQANFFSKASQSINSKSTSIVRRLASRCLTENGIRIQIHQHIGYLLYIVWNVTDHNDFKSKRCLERVFLDMGRYSNSTSK